MGLGKFVRENLVLLAGIALPVVMMAGFLVASSLPQTLANPPQYDLVFFVDDYSSSNGNTLPATVNLVVRNGTLVAQYVPATGNNAYGYWKKIYRFEAATRTIREIPFGLPSDVDTLTAMREEPVAGLEQVRLDTRLQAPDGYELSSDEYRGNGLIGDLFWRNGSGRPRLRNGASSVPLELASDTQYYTYGNIQFLGWVLP
jgi:hypothetical protein